MAVNDINLGTSPTGAGGDNVREAFEKTNANFHDQDQRIAQASESAQAATDAAEQRMIALVESVAGDLGALRADLLRGSYLIADEDKKKLVNYTGIFDLTRPGPTTVWDAAGNLVTVPSGEPAFDHDPVSGEPLGQQIVAFPVTNYFRSSTTLTYWEEQGATITDASEPVPFVEGGMADVLTANAGTSLHGMRSTVYVNQGNQTRYTYIVKPSNIKRVGWGRYAVDGSNLIVFDFEEVSVVQDGTGFINGDIVALREGWFKISFTLIAGTTTTAYLPRFYLLPPSVAGSYDGLNASWETQGNESLAFFFLQATDGDVDLPLIYTTNSQQTRPADDLRTIGDPRTQPYWNSAGVTVVMQIKRAELATGMVLYGGSSTRRFLYTSGDVYRCFDGDTTVDLLNGPDLSVEYVTVGISITPTERTLSVAGAHVTGPHNGTLLTQTDSLRFGVGVYPWISLSLGRFEIINRALSAAELDAITGAGS